MKKILLHGATNRGSSNYGDYLYGEMLYRYIKSKGYEVLFYQASDFFINNIKEYKNSKYILRKKNNVVVYMPGGYFGESPNQRIRDTVIFFLRFFPLGLWAAFKRIPIAVIGIGAGPFNNWIIRISIKKICNHAVVVTVRDHESFLSLTKLCPKANIIECGDLIITGNYKKEGNMTETIRHIKGQANGKKLLLVHYNHNKKALSLFAECLNSFLENHRNEYYVVVASDSVLNFDLEYYHEFEQKLEYKCCYYKYDSPDEMTTLIQNIDLVLTCKLHVGVVACLNNKSVIVAACHYEKTKRFYNQILEDERCVDLYSVSSEKLLEILELYFNKKIYIDESVICNAARSWNILSEFLEETNDR